MSRIAPRPAHSGSSYSVLLLAALAATLPTVGCGDAVPTTTVRGKVSYDGKPATHGVINFIAPGGKPLGGPIKSDGTYEAELPVGEYQVRIDAPPQLPKGFKEGEPLPELAPRLIPEKYASFVSSGLKAAIRDQSNPQELDFPLP